VIEYRHAWGEERVYFFDASGHMQRIPTSWTNVVEDPFVVIAAGRSPLRLEELLELADLLDRLKSGEV